MKPRILHLGCFGIALALAGWLCASCESTTTEITDQRVNWTSRVGTYTYDQAVTELGTPERTVKLSNGSTQAEWIKKGGGGGPSVSFTSDVSGTNADMGTVEQAPAEPRNSRVLTLVFNANNVLVSWRREF